ncbi:MAG: xanthine dehydrogenase FAD-binding subunit XdhB [Eubacteriales bacterium]|nr:xanthine dehydrogenase FAD-binding subunit XdhB [Eubacteriales bacterium]
MYDFSALYEATSVQNAVELMQAHPSAVLIAGGSDVLIKMREGKLAGAELISIYKLDELREVTMDPDGALRIGPMTSFSHATNSPMLQKYMPVLGESADTAGGPQLRSIGTLGGTICTGVTSADTASTQVAYDAVLEITSVSGIRKLSIHDFYKGPGKVDLQPGELLTAILIPKESYENCFGYYIKYAMRNAMDIATIGCSVNVVLSPDRKTIRRMRIAYGVAGPVPMRARTAEAALNGMPVGEAAIAAIGEEVLKDVNPRTSWRASAEFRKQIISETARRGLKAAIERAGGVF